MIDSHQHFWIYNKKDYGWIDGSMEILQQDFLPEHLQYEQKKAGFSGSIAVQARQSLEETEWLLELAAKNPFIKGVVGWVDLCYPQVEDQLIKYSKHPKFVGVRHVIQDEPDDNFILRPDFMNGIRMLRKFNLTYDILVFPKHLANARIFAAHFPEQPFVLDHIAKPLIKDKKLSPWKEDILQLGAMKNVYCKVSGMVTEADWKGWKNEDFRPYLDIVFEAFGPERIMIGSDWPVCTVAGTYSSVMEIVLDYLKAYPASIQEMVLGGNAKRFYCSGDRR